MIKIISYIIVVWEKGFNRIFLITMLLYKEEGQFVWEGRVMLIRDGLVFLGGEYVRRDLRVSEGVFLQIEEPGTLGASEGEEVLEAFGKKILPGLVDIHTHGRAGEDFSFADEAVLKKLCASYAADGVTAVLATTMTNEPETMKRSMAAIAAFCEEQATTGAEGARVFGVHAEGPFLGEKKKGAHDAAYLWEADAEKYEELFAACGGTLRLLAIDPELDGAETLIHRCKEDGVTVSLAHTACGYDTACEAAEWGADHVTHLFNAMQPLHHREPGLIGAAVDKGMYVELICDGIHLHPAIIRMMFALCPEKVLLISDSMQAAGLSDGEYELGGIKVYVKDGKATQADGTIAGSTISVYDAVVNAIRFGVPEEQAVLSATYLPAKSVGLENETGSIECGRAADFIVVDADWNLEAVYIGGKFIKKIFKRSVTFF